jgi:hypothetical protein
MNADLHPKPERECINRLLREAGFGETIDVPVESS